MTPSNTVNEAIERLYAAFGDHPKPEDIGYCTHCFSDAEIQLLLSRPLREISADELSSYASSAFLTAGEAADYLYFLPRIIEVSLQDEFFWPDLEITGRCINDSGFQTWPENRQKALLSVFDALLDQVLEEKNFFEIDGLLCTLGKIDTPLQPYLAKIGANREAVLEYWTCNAKTLDEGKLGNPFWKPTDSRQQEIIDWFTSPAILLIYAEAYGMRYE